MAKHIQGHGSVWTDDIVSGVIKKLIYCIKELVLDGNKVELGDLGAFYPAVSSKGAKDFESFNTATNIRKVRANFKRGKAINDLKEDSSFQIVLTRSEEAKAKKEIYG